MVFKFLDAREAKEFGTSLAAFYCERVPAAEAGQKKRQPKGKKQETANRVIQRVETYKRENKLNFYQKSQLGNAFKWAMLDAGQERAFVDELTFQIMLKLR